MRTLYEYFFLLLFCAIVFACGGGDGGSGDTTKPTVPTGLTASATSASQIDLSWTAATDAVGVAGYKIYRNGVYLKSESGVSTSDTGLSASTQYCYTVSAYDAANNESAQSVQVCAVTYASVWFKTYNNVLASLTQDNGKSVKQTSDGGYIIAGSVNFPSQTDYDVLLIKTDAKGEPFSFWIKTFGGSGNDYGKSVQQTTDGGYIVLGEYAGSSSRQMWLIKTDSSGNKEWDRNYGYNDADENAAEVQQTSDGGYILIGSTGGTYKNVFLVKTDASGNTQWYKQKGYDNSNERGASVQETSDGGYILTGMTDQFDSSGDIWLVKVAADGSTAWHRHFGTGGIYDEGTSVRQTADGGYIIAGETGPLANRDIYLLKTDSVGNQQWSRTLGGTKSDWSPMVQQTADGGYIISGSTYSYGAGLSDGFLVKTDAQGKMLWQNTFGGSGQDYFYSVQQTQDGGYIMVGSTESYGDGTSDVYLVKTDANGSSLP